MTKLCSAFLNMKINWKLVDKSNAQFWSALKWERVLKKWTYWAGTSWWRCCCVSVGNQSWPSSKITTHLYIKYHVHIDVLISRLNIPFPHLITCNAVNILKCNTGVRHLFFNILSPKASPILSVNLICFFYCLGKLYPKLMWCVPIIIFYLRNNPISVSQSLLKPLVEGRFITYLICHGLFSQINWFGLFKVL